MRNILSSRESKWIAWLVLLAGCAAMAPVACAQIIGADKDRILATDASPSTASTSVSTNTVAPCTDDQKRCAGACVAIDDPQFGCTASDCAPCDVPYAASAKCTGGTCAVATCTPGRADCNGQGADGCEADLGTAATCGSCTTACGGAVGPYCTPSGQCVSSCGSLTLCDTSCRQLADNADNCGTCGHVCPGGAHAVGECAASMCGITCDVGWGDCNSSEADGCEKALSPYYPDADGDGYGAMGSTSAGSACTAPAGSASNASDCLDTGALASSVHPAQTNFFTSSYITPGGLPSFDYDCDGKETALSSFPLGGSCAPCTTGYLQVSGAKYANAFCGSTQLTTCTLATSPSCSTATQGAVGCN